MSVCVVRGLLQCNEKGRGVEGARVSDCACGLPPVYTYTHTEIQHHSLLCIHRSFVPETCTTCMQAYVSCV